MEELQRLPCHARTLFIRVEQGAYRMSRVALKAQQWRQSHYGTDVLCQREYELPQRVQGTEKTGYSMRKFLEARAQGQALNGLLCHMTFILRSKVRVMTYRK